MLIDIGSASVGAALVLLHQDKKPRVLFTHRSAIPFQKSLNFERFVTGTERAIDTVAEAVIKKGLPHLSFTPYGKKRVDTIVCFFASPWYTSQTRRIHLEKDTPFIITEETVRDIIHAEEKSFAQSRLALFTEGAGEGQIIERRIIDMRLDGYSVSAPFGKRARSVHAALFLSMVPQAIITRFTERLRRVLHVRDIGYHTFPFAAFTVLRDRFAANEDFLFLDITGEVTDVVLAKEGVLLETLSFPKGRHFVVRTLADAFGTTEHEALSLLAMHGTHSAETRTALKIEETLFRVQKEWLASFSDVLRKLGENVGIPHTIFYTADSDVQNLFKSFLSEEQFGQTSLTEAPFRVMPLDESFAASSLDRADRAPTDPFLALEGIFLQKLLCIPGKTL